MAPVEARIFEGSDVAPTIVDLAVEGGWGCVLRNDRSVDCWGHGDPAVRQGLREPSTRWNQARKLEGVTDVVDISTNAEWTCVALGDGSVRCWGRLDRRFKARGGESIVEVALGDNLCVRSSTGLVWCADPHYSQFLGRIILEDAIEIGAHGHDSCALDTSGAAWCWDFTLMDGPVADPFTGKSPVEWKLLVHRPKKLRMMLPGATGLVVDRAGPCVSRDGAIWCEEEDGAALVLEGVVAFVGSATDNCAIDINGRLSCVGDNTWAQLGTGDSTPTSERVELSAVSGARLLDRTPSSTCAALRDGVHCWGTRMTLHKDPPVRERHQLVLDATGIAADKDFTCASTKSDGLWCWGTREAKFPREDPVREDPEGIFGVARPRRVDLDIGPLAKIEGNCFSSQTEELACGHFDRGGPGDFVVEHRDRGIRDVAKLGAGWCWIRAGVVSCARDLGAPSVLTIRGFRNAVALSGHRHTLCAIHDAGRVSCTAVYFDDDKLRSLPTKPVGELTGARFLGPVHSLGASMLDDQGRAWTWSIRRSVDYDGHVSLIVGEPKLLRAKVGALATVAGKPCIWAEDQLECPGIDLRPGDSLFGQVGRRAPAEPIGDVVQLVGGGGHVCVRHGQGGVTCLGDNRFGQLGVPPATVMATPLAIEFE
ncbi:MAG: hypothetical protein R6X02_01750 [Enhygromyxa sp.]